MHESPELGYLHQLGQDATHVAQDDFTTLPIDPHCSPYKRAEAKAGCEIEAVTVEDDLSGAPGPQQVVRLLPHLPQV